MNLDGVGFQGMILHYAFIIFLVGSTFFIFLYLWRKGKLDMDEEPKQQMMREEKSDE